MSKSKNHQQTHGLSQIDEQLNKQIQAAVEIQGESKLDQEIITAANEHNSELDEIIDN